MTLLTNILYWVSSALLVPSIVVLLVLLLVSLFLLGGFYGTYLGRLRFRRAVLDTVASVRSGLVLEEALSTLIPMKNLFGEHLRQLIEAKWDGVHAEKILADFDGESSRVKELPRMMIRLGPMLGLMGTLIPMGPALVGLAAGDIGALAVNIQVAFSTTVVGVFIGGVGFVVHLFKDRWHVEDMNTLQYLCDVASQKKDVR